MSLSTGSSPSFSSPLGLPIFLNDYDHSINNRTAQYTFPIKYEPISAHIPSENNDLSVPPSTFQTPTHIDLTPQPSQSLIVQILPHILFQLVQSLHIAIISTIALHMFLVIPIFILKLLKVF